MRWSLFFAWLALIGLGGASAMLFWSSFNRILGGGGSAGDWLRGVVGILGVAVSLALARWVLVRSGVLGEVREGEEKERVVAGEEAERSRGT
ncbi:MAG: hypothetical protein RMK01_05830 [Thermomicrobium sp.]|nr:hypothetical protein [Thermomicrobium sp.]MDW8059576.1 hypothetical protein [Thermomicrobium sp.]